MNSFENKRPFAGELKPSEFADKGKEGTLFSLDELPNKVVRLRHVDISSKEKIAKVVAEVKEAKELMSSLEKDRVRVAHTEYIVGEKDLRGGGEVYTLTEKIDGKNLDDIKFYDTAMVREIDQFCANYLSHVQRILRDGGNYWADWRMENVVYGTREGDIAPHVYVVDVDPITNSWTREENGANNTAELTQELRSLILTLHAFLIEIRNAESEKTENGAKFDMTNEKFMEIVNSLFPVVASLDSNVIKDSFSSLQKSINTYVHPS